MKTIQQTQEVIAAVAVLALHLRADLADGKMSFFEIVGLAKDVPAVSRALSGISEVPKELLDLDDTETAQVSTQIGELLVSMGQSHRVGDISAELIRAAVQITRSILNILHLPPVPEIVK